MTRKTAVRIVGGICLIALSAFLLLSLITFDKADFPSAKWPPNDTIANKGGVAGACLGLWMRHAAGVASWLIPLVLVGVGIVLLKPSLLKDWQMKVVGVVVLIPSTAALFHVVDKRLDIHWENPGGIVGLLIGDALLTQLGAGAFLLLGALVLAGVLLSTDRLLWLGLRGLWGLLGMFWGVWQSYAKRCRTPKEEPEATATANTAKAAAQPATDRRAGERQATLERREAEKLVALEKREAEERAAEEQRQAEKLAREEARGARLAENLAAKEAAVKAKAAKAQAKPKPKPERPEPEHMPGAAADPRTLDRTDERTEYRLPPLELLDVNVPSSEKESDEVVRERAAILERTLEEFNIEANVVEIDRGPVITQYEIELAAGIKITKVAGLSDDLARALKAQSVRIVAPIPGKSTIGIEVPNNHREIVMLRELIESGVLERKRMTIPLLLGKDASGTPLVTDLAQMPHLLIAGATGSGKSVCINTLLLSILMTQYPDNLKVILVDPKMVELATYEEIPHLMCPVLTDMKRTAQVLEWATVKMDERYGLFSQVGVRNVAAYNKLGESGIRERLRVEDDAKLDDVPTHLPMIIIIIDELADLMMTAAKEAEYAITRLAQKSRAVGIHIVMATQRPSVNVITGLIKANMPSRIAFQTTSMIDSRTILDKNGAEMLLGQGDMLFLPPGTSDLIRGQGAFASDAEIQRIADFWKSQGQPVYDNELVGRKKTSEVPPQERDDMYLDAVRVVLSTQRGSVSLLQRKLQVGYSRAARLVDMMAEEGLVGEYKGSQAREVLFSLDEWEKSNAADLGLEPDAEPGFDDDESDYDDSDEDDDTGEE